ncbi:MAG: hypothetical protein ACRDRK_19170 [Pseudonocardia sp.]
MRPGRPRRAGLSGCCPRAFLREAVAAEAGLAVRAAFENEFYLARPTPDGPPPTPDGPRPWGDGPVYSSAGLDRAAPVMLDITRRGRAVPGGVGVRP